MNRNLHEQQVRPANHLAEATSPYLLQHAHNPVDWYPWGPEALRRARDEDKPIFLSIGYSSCHWCHVMAHESFENEAIAELLNRDFISIKVDREERPDLDEIYMRATMLYNHGSGGWPMSVFLMPDGRPFFAGTYFPPDSRYGRPGFADVLTTIAKLWKSDRSRLQQGAEALTEAVRQFGQSAPGDSVPGPEPVQHAAKVYAQAFDRHAGGLISGQTNKFPPSMAMQLMLRRYHGATTEGEPDTELLSLVELTLEHMANGGIYDHLGGGICRYSTDPDWFVPHFEKMLYDQALVTDVYLDAYLLTRKPLYARVARNILDYCLRDLRSPEGGFYSARDADSEGFEGKYYLWTLEEIRERLTPRDAQFFAAYYGVTQEGNWRDGHGHTPPGANNILHVSRPADIVARLCNVGADELDESLERSRGILLDARDRRVPPGLDDKILTSWNGLLTAVLARASCVLEDSRYLEAARGAATFILDRLTKDGRLLRTYRKGTAHTGGYLDDYAFFIEALLNLYEADFDAGWLEHAIRLTEQSIRHFEDRRDGGFFYTADDAEEILVRAKDTGDGAVPGGNSVHALNLLRLAAILDRADFRERAEAIFRTFAARIEQSTSGNDRMLAALDFYHQGPTEVVVIGSPRDPATKSLLQTIRQEYLPNRVVLCVDPDHPSAVFRAATNPLLRNRTMLDQQPTAYVCRAGTCMPAINKCDRLVDLL